MARPIKGPKYGPLVRAANFLGLYTTYVSGMYVVLDVPLPCSQTSTFLSCVAQSCADAFGITIRSPGSAHHFRDLATVFALPLGFPLPVA